MLLFLRMSRWNSDRLLIVVGVGVGGARGQGSGLGDCVRRLARSLAHMKRITFVFILARGS
jgi:hypothetical protein